jgi:hypothetical protein
MADQERVTKITRLVHVQIGGAPPDTCLGAMNTLDKVNLDLPFNMFLIKSQILGNIINNPTEEKFRKIPTKSKLWQSYIDPVEGARLLLIELGIPYPNPNLLELIFSRRSCSL